MNYLAQTLNEFDIKEKFVFQAAVEACEHTKNTADLINLALNINCYEVIDEIYDHEDAGRYLMQQQTLDGCTINFLEGYIDYEKFGKEYSKEHHCHLLDNEAFLDGDKKPFFREYDGNVLNIPAESRITPIETESEYFDEKFSTSTQLAFELDKFFRDFDRNYAHTYFDETKAQMFLSDCIMNGETDFIKKELAGLKIDRNDYLPARLAAYESKYIKSVQSEDKTEINAFVENGLTQAGVEFTHIKHQEQFDAWVKAHSNKKPSVREQLQNTKKELGDKSDPKPPYKALPKL